MRVDRMKKSTPVEEDIWILRTPVHDHHRRIQQGKLSIVLLVLVSWKI